MKTITNEQCVQFLNELLVLDKEAVEGLFFHKVHCNKALADHPTVQCSKAKDGVIFPVGKGYQTRLLGVLNGLFGNHDKHPNWGTIAMKCNLDEDGNATEILGFFIVTEEMVEGWMKPKTE